MLISFARNIFPSHSSVAIGTLVIWALFLLTYSLILYYTMNIQYCGSCDSTSKYKLDAEAMGSTLLRNRGGLVVMTEHSEVVAKPAEVSKQRRSHWPRRLTYF